jgi:hypothetical protein
MLSQAPGLCRAETAPNLGGVGAHRRRITPTETLLISILIVILLAEDQEKITIKNGVRGV